MTVDNVSGRYAVGRKVAETSRYRLYVCRPNGETAADHLLQIATAVEHDGALERSAYILERLTREAERLEALYAETKTDPNHFVNYQLHFPALVDTFVAADQESRRTNILRFSEVGEVGRMVPLYNLVERDRRRVDLRTSIWILGKLLKAMSLAHGIGVAVKNLTPGNILIEPDQHYVVIFNWVDAELMSDGVPQSTVREEIRSAATSVIRVLGGDPEKGIPDDGGPWHAAYQQHLMQLAATGESNALEAHRAFYALVDSLWERGFHPFTSLPR